MSATHGRRWRRSRRPTRSRVDSGRWNSTTARRRRRRPRCCTTISTSCTGSRRSSGRCPARRSRRVRRGFRSIGVEDNSFTFFPELMDSASLFLTANCDTIYFWGFVDLSDGPMVIDVPALGAPSGILGTIDDMWFRWVTDVGLPGPTVARAVATCSSGRATTGRCPTAASTSRTSRTSRVTVIGRAFMVDNDPAPAVEAIRAGVRVSPYVPGAQGTAVGSFLAGTAPLGAVAPDAGDPFRRGVGHVVQHDHAERLRVLGARQRAGPAGAAGRRRSGAAGPAGLGRDRSRASRSSPTSGCARSSRRRSPSATPPPAPSRSRRDPRRASPSTRARSGSSALFVGGYEFLDPPPQITADGVVASPSDGARKLNSRTNFFYMATGITPAMCMRLTGIGSQYIYAMRDSEGEYLDGARDYRLTLPPDIPESRFWSVILYDRQTRSMLQTDQPLPRLGSQSGTVETNPDGSTDIYFGPTAPGRQGEQLAPDRPRQGLVDDPPALQPARSRSSTRPGGRARSSP